MTNDALHDTAEELVNNADAISDGARQGAAKRAEELRHRAEEVRHRAQGMVKDLPARDVTVKAQATASGLLSKAESAPDSAYLAGVGSAMLLSMLLMAGKKPSLALFVGAWPATILSLLMVLKQRRPSQEMASPTEAMVGDPLMAE